MKNYYKKKSLEENKLKKLSLVDIETIKALVSEKKYRQVDIAKRFGVTQGHVSNICRGFTRRKNYQ